MGSNSFTMGFGGGFMWLFWIILIIVVVWFSKYFFGNSHNSKEKIEKSALSILNERYARGEIQQQEYEQKKRDLDI
jgi:putative membrane protein